MSLRSAITGLLALGFISLVVVGSMLIWPGKPVVNQVVSDSLADGLSALDTGREEELMEALHERDLEIEALRSELVRLELLPDQQRVPVEAELHQDDKSMESAGAPASDSGDLATAVQFLKTKFPDRFGNLTPEEAAALVTLDLGGPQLTDADLAVLAALPSLETVSLEGASVTDAGLVHLYGLPRLKSIDLRGTQVTGAGISLLPAYGLEALHLTDTHVTGHDLREFPPLPNLKKLKLNRLDFGDESVADLALFPRVEHLELDGTRISDDGLRLLLAQNTALKRVELRDTGVSPDTVSELHKVYPNVELVLAQPLRY